MQAVVFEFNEKEEQFLFHIYNCNDENINSYSNPISIHNFLVEAVNATIDEEIIIGVRGEAAKFQLVELTVVGVALLANHLKLEQHWLTKIDIYKILETNFVSIKISKEEKELGDIIIKESLEKRDEIKNRIFYNSIHRN